MIQIAAQLVLTDLCSIRFSARRYSAAFPLTLLLRNHRRRPGTGFPLLAIRDSLVTAVRPTAYRENIRQSELNF
ncbi:hypothetical protein KCP78_08725 [Salmonella enterica subsp. enterica]|nr:hypothetical protein KCP78_08725 [Salmonella enterica subsp. enterica]